MDQYLSHGAVDRSGTITTANKAQVVAPDNPMRTSLYIQNVSSGDLWVCEFTSNQASAGAGSYRLVAGDGFDVATGQQVTIFGATAGQAYTATEL